MESKKFKGWGVLVAACILSFIPTGIMAIVFHCTWLPFVKT